MPLLRKRGFERTTDHLSLADDDEVFHCELTDEIFKDYEEYCERIILVNSIVWSCEMTGKANLTYAEALESERRARKSLRDFPIELRVPMIYLASRTRRTTFADMSDDVFNFVRDKYFIGETVEASLDGDRWSDAHVLSVTMPKRPPTAEPVSSPTKACTYYMYEVEQFDEEDAAKQGQIAIVTHDRIRRNRSVFTREKNKMYLRQFVEQGIAGIMQVKENILQKYNIARVKFDQIFAGEPPAFPSSKKFDKLLGNAGKGNPKENGLKKHNPDKKPRQETMSKYITKIDGSNQSKLNGNMNNVHLKSNNIHGLDSNSNKSLKDEMFRVGRMMQQRRDEEKTKKKEKSVMFAAYIREWNKIKDDLELVDHKTLPTFIPVELAGIPNKYFGDFVGILEFLLEFNKPLKVKDFFLHGVDCELLRRALVVEEVAGPLSDLIQLLLSAVFSLQEEEAEEYSDRGMNKIINTNDIKDDAETDNTVVMTLDKGIQLATTASKWARTYMGTPLGQLPLDSHTYSEILRLHLLASGGSTGDNCARWRYQQRGGYNPQDDPGLLLKMKEPHIVKALSNKHVTQLPLSYKFKIIDCLINQILTYATIRDIIEEKQEKVNNVKKEIRALQAAERKREADVIISRQKIRREASAKKEEEKMTGEKLKAFEQNLAKSMENLKKDSETKRLQFENKMKSLHSESFSYQTCLGLDRAYRKYWIYESIEGVFVEHSDEFSGRCLEKPVIPNTELASAPPEDTLNFMKKMFENELNSGVYKEGYSDKENDSDNVSPRKSNGYSNPSGLSDSKVSLIQDLLMCTASPTNCSVHSSAYPKTRWSFIASVEDFEKLVGSLNKRGLREGDLKKLILRQEDLISKYIAKCQINLLNPTVFPAPGKLEVQMKVTRRYADSNLGFPPDTDTSEVLECVLRDSILDLEEKIHLGALGDLKVDNRDTWRDSISKRGYDKQCSSLIWGYKRTNIQKSDETPKTEESSSATVVYKDPGFYLNALIEMNADLEELSEDKKCANLNAVRQLASALLQIGQAVNDKHLKRPLGFDEKERTKDVNYQFEALRRWELSLMECMSFGQVMLHLEILENSIIWSRSILNANCRICRKKSDDENMLLCDNCNKGHHIYCLKPKLTKIPKGDWFCNQCKPKEKSPQKKNRKVFNDEDSGEEMNDSQSWNTSSVIPLCTSCKSGGPLIHCIECEKGWHSECMLRPLQRKGGFTCSTCAKQSRQDKEWDPRVPRRCAADAMNNIDHYKKMLKRSPRHDSDSDSGDEPLSTKARSKRLSKGSSPDGDQRRAKRSKRSLPTNDSNYNSESDEPISTLRSQRNRKDHDISNDASKKSSRLSNENHKKNLASTINGYFDGITRKSRRSEAIHTEQLEELLNDVTHHKDSWPFNAPVTKEEVPDYFEIISNPMDFGTIKEKLQEKKYANDLEFMSDAALVFENCYRYNHDDDVVAKAGGRLQKFFEKKCRDYNLVHLAIDEFEPDPKKRKGGN